VRPTNKGTPLQKEPRELRICKGGLLHFEAEV
jgi:hypothetical protein